MRQRIRQSKNSGCRAHYELMSFIDFVKGGMQPTFYAFTWRASAARVYLNKKERGFKALERGLSKIPMFSPSDK
jgi:hypothetical protein